MIENSTTLDLPFASSLLEGVSCDEPVPAGRTVLVFRTSVADRACVDALGPWLDQLVGRAGRWTFDLEDRDRVLRIETDRADTVEVLRVMRDRGQECTALD
jgi:hypothetical protein